MPFVGVSFSEHRRPNIHGVRSLITSSTVRSITFPRHCIEVDLACHNATADISITFGIGGERERVLEFERCVARGRLRDTKVHKVHNALRIDGFAHAPTVDSWAVSIGFGNEATAVFIVKVLSIRV